jgi:hypothetical protein
VSLFQEAKGWFVVHTGLAKDALHLYVALGVLFGACALFGWRIGSWRPWALVLLAAVGGELWDIYDRTRIGKAQALAGNWHDIWNMMLWPTVVTLLARAGRLRVLRNRRE